MILFNFFKFNTAFPVFPGKEVEWEKQRFYIRYLKPALSVKIQYQILYLQKKKTMKNSCIAKTNVPQ